MFGNRDGSQVTKVFHETYKSITPATDCLQALTYIRYLIAQQGYFFSFCIYKAANLIRSTIQKEVIWGMAIIGIFLIITACINFINLATAQAIKRAKEVGMRKVLGSGYWQIMLQFLGETFLITLTATLLSVILTELALPYLNQLLELEISFSVLGDPAVLLFLILEVILVTLFAGMYTAFILARFQPINALRSRMSTQQVAGLSLRQALVVVQFTICQVLIICTLVVSEQMDYFRNKSLGFDKEGVITLRLPVNGAEKLMFWRFR